MYPFENTKEYLSVISQNLEEVFNVLSDGVYITDNSGKTLFVNRMYERLTGMDRERLLGRSVAALQKEGVFDVVLNPKVIKRKRVVTAVQQLANGKRIFLWGYPVFGDNREVLLVITFARDITMMSQMREQIVQQRELITRYHDQFEQMSLESTRYEGHIFISEKIQDTISLLKRVADTDATILLTGETGVGKDVMARMVHSHSPRKSGDFLKVDCSSIAENLIESELFGYVPGAFSGASAKGKTGYFEMADKGTLFLDEVGELPLSMQVKLLRVLQDQEIMRVGSGKVHKVDIRIIAATNRNLEEEVAKGRFRTDLFYRLRVAVLDIPPLRERQADIIPLAKHFIKGFSTKYRKPAHFSREVFQLFKTHHWPGNVREMQNLIQGLIVTSEDGYITPTDLPVALRGEQSPLHFDEYHFMQNNQDSSLKEVVAGFERKVLTQAIKQHGTVSKAAAALQVNRTTIFRKLQKKKSKA